MAEREGFEPPIALRLWLISSQLHSTGLCHLSSPEIHFTASSRCDEVPLSATTRSPLCVRRATARAANAHNTQTRKHATERSIFDKDAATRRTTSIAALVPPRLHRLRRLRRAIHRHIRDLDIVHRLDPQLLTQFAVHPREDLFVLLQEVPHVFASLPDALTAVAVPRAALLHDIVQHRQVQHIALARDPLAIQDVELGIAERRRHLVLDDLHLRARPNNRLAFLHRADAPNVDTHRRIELQRTAARRRLRIAEHHADLLADLVNK